MNQLEQKIREVMRALEVELASGDLTQFGATIVCVHNDDKVHVIWGQVTDSIPAIHRLLHETIGGLEPEKVAIDLSSQLVRQ